MAGKLGNAWPRIVLGVTVLVYVVYFAMAVYTFLNMPPIPDRVVTRGGEVLFTAEDVIEGKYLFQKYGLWDYGSFLGFGGYFGIDYTAFTIQILREEVSKMTGLAFDSPELKQYLVPQFEKPYAVLGGPTGEVVVSDEFGKAFHKVVEFYSRYFGEMSSEIGLRSNLITDPEEVRKIAAFFTWGAMIALAGYTNGFPYTPGLVEPNIHVTVSTWVTFFLLLLIIMPLAGYIFLKLLQHWHDQRVTVELPPPNRAQRLALLGFVLAVMGLGLQGLLGGYMMHKYAEPATLYGISTNDILPFNAARALHYTLAVLWVVVSWVSFSLFALPYLGIQLSERQVLAILGAGGAVAVASLVGMWAAYLGLIPDPLWFIIGAQGRPVVNVATLWLLLIAAVAFYLSYLFYRASRVGPELLRPFAKILAIALGGTAMGAVVGALPIAAPWHHFTIDEYFRWITIHAFVEGFWPPIVITILLILLVVAGLVPPSLALVVAGLDATLEIATGMIGTAHHYYWGGQPTFWMYVGAVFSTLEVLPIGFLIAYTILLWKRGEVRTDLQKVLVRFILVAAFGGAIGVVAFGAGLINMPVINYYVHGLQSTMVHAHLAYPLSYGVPTMLMWTVAFYLAGGFDARSIRRILLAVVLFAAGLYLQVALSLGLLTAEQFREVVDKGYWFAKTLYTPSMEPGFWQQPHVKAMVWARVIGDLVTASAIAIFMIEMLRGLPRALRR